jgi:hypothetical protein
MYPSYGNRRKLREPRLSEIQVGCPSAAGAPIFDSHNNRMLSVLQKNKDE